MDELLRQSLVVIRSMWRHRRIAVLAAWIAGVLAAGIVLRIPDKYEASARIHVDTQSILKPLMAGLAVSPNVEQQIALLSRTLVSRPNIEKLIRMADLDLKTQSKAEQDALIDRLMKTLEIRGTARDNLYTVVYRDENPEKAKRVVQALVSIFVESSLGDKRKDSDSAKRFIDDQIKGYEKKLEEAETRLKEFKLRNLDLAASDSRSSTEQLADTMQKLSAARLDLKEATNSRDALKRQLAGEEPVLIPDSTPGETSITIPEIDGRIESLKRNLDGLLQRFTEQHPDVIGTRRMISDLEEQRKTEIAARKKVQTKKPVSGTAGNPVYQQLRVSLGEAEAQVASLQARVSEYESRQAKAREGLKLAPQVEAEYAQLNRDYEVHKRNYEQFVSRRESANISGELESTASVADFRLIDPPRADNKPVAPNRILLLAFGLVASMLAGLATAFVASQVRPVFVDSRSLRETTGLPLLGAVTAVVGEAQRKQERRSLLRMLAALGALVAAYGAGMAAMTLLSSRLTG
jgi:polysaccharide chain length determinant protein (PEP-CTERM system associated)